MTVENKFMTYSYSVHDASYCTSNDLFNKRLVAHVSTSALVEQSLTYKNRRIFASYSYKNMLISSAFYMFAVNVALSLILSM